MKKFFYTSKLSTMAKIHYHPTFLMWLAKTSKDLDFSEFVVSSWIKELRERAAPSCRDELVTCAS